MNDLASIALMFDASSATKAAGQMDQATAASGRAQAAADALAGETRKLTNAYDDFYQSAQRDFAGQYVQQQARVTGAHAKGAAGAKLQSYELINLGRNFADVGTQAAMMQNPLLILIQQGPQIADVFTTAAARGVTFKAALAGIVEEFAPFAAGAAAIAAVVGPLVALGIAAQQYHAQVKEAEQATLGLGKAAGLTGEELMRLADQSASAGDISVQAARKGAEAYVSAGIANHDVISGLIKVQRDYALVTGQDAAQANAELAKAFADLTSGVGTLDGKLNFLDGHTREHILNLAKQTDQTYAQKAALVELQKELDNSTAALDRNAGGWHGVVVQIQNWWDALGQLVNPGLDDKIARVQTAMKPLQDLKQQGKLGAIGQRDLSTMEATLQALQAQRTAADLIAKRGAAQSAENDATKAALDNYRQLVPIEAQRADVETRLNKARADAKAGRITSIQLDQAEAAAKVQLAQLDRRAAGPQDHSGENRAARLSREAEAQQATIKGNYDLAAAYAVSDAAALKALATTKATAAALTQQGDIDAFVSRQIAQDVSERAVAGAKAAATLDAENRARKAAYDQVAAGTITMAQANQQISDSAALRDLETARDLASGEAKDTLTQVIQRLTQAQAEKHRLDLEAQSAAVAQGQNDEIARMQLELQLIGASNTERAIRLARLKTEQEMRAGNRDPLSEAGQAEIKRAEDLARMGEQLSRAQADYNAELTRTVDYLQEIGQQATDTGGKLEQAFGGVSKSLANAIHGITGLIGAMNALERVDAANRANRSALAQSFYEQDQNTVASMADFEAQAYRQIAEARLATYADMAQAGRSFFKEGSDGYKAMTALEIAFRSIQLLGSIRAMAATTTETGVAVTQSGIRAAALGAEAYVKTLASQPFPYNLAAGAVVLAAIASVGVALRGGGGAGGVPISQQRQDAQGAGTVLGDTKAKSDSIAKSLEIAASNSNKMLQFYNPMLQALRSIDNQISSFAAAVARSLGAGGMLDASSLGLGSKSGSLIGGLFGPSVSASVAKAIGGFFGGSILSQTITKTLKDQGLQFSAATLGDIMSRGLSGSAYADIVTKTSNKFLGAQISSSTSKKTITSPFDADFQRQADLLIGSLRSGVLAAAGVLGVEGAQATLDAFKLDLGKISLKGLTGDEITKAIEGVFSKAADQMAGAVLPGLSTFQKVGEGLFETLTRLAKDYQTVDTGLKSIGKTFGMVGVSSIAAREHLVDLFGSLDDFQSGVSFYAENFLTEAERLAPIQDAVTAELARLGLTGVKTRDQFKAVVQGLDVSTAAGADLFAALMNLAPAFAAITEESKQLTDAKSALSSAYDRESGALKDTRDKLRDLATSLHTFGAGLYNGPTAALSPEAAYMAAQAEFQRVSGLARTGDQAALGDLQNVSQAYLDASKAYFASSEGYFADLAAVRDAVTAAEGVAGQQADLAQQQLDQMTAAVGQLIDLNQNVVTVAQAIAALQALLGGNGSVTNPTTVAATSSASNDNSAVVAQLQALNESQAQTNATLQAQIQQQAAINAAQAERDAQIEEQLAKLNRTAQAS